MFFVFGLTGSICCGKSNVTKTLRAHNIPIIDADIVARQVVEPGSIGLANVIHYFGSEYLNPDGTLNRQELGKLVFSKPEKLLQLNKITHPLILQEVDRQMLQLEEKGYPFAGYDSALIVESGNAEIYSPLIVVACSPEQQLERLMKRGTGHGPLTRDEALLRINAQMSIAQKVAVADIVIDTSKSIEESIKQTEVLAQKLFKMSRQ